MKKLRSIVGYFEKSTQATSKLLNFQSKSIILKQLMWILLYSNVVFVWIHTKNVNRCYLIVLIRFVEIVLKRLCIYVLKLKKHPHVQCVVMNTNI
jgi:hypothetical protein